MRGFDPRQAEADARVRRLSGQGRRKATFRHGRKATIKARARLVLGKTQAKPRRHVVSPATVREIAQSLGLTAKDLAAGRSLVDSLNL